MQLCKHNVPVVGPMLFSGSVGSKTAMEDMLRAIEEDDMKEGDDNSVSAALAQPVRNVMDMICIIIILLECG